MPLLVFVGVQNGFVGTRLVDEAVTVCVDLEPRLRGHPEHADITRFGRFRTVFLIRTDGAAVKRHGGMRLIHLRADPEACADAVTMSAQHRTVAADHAKRPRLQRFEHLVVERIAAGGNHGAFGCDVTHVLAVLIGGNAAGDASVLALELDHLGVVVKAGALLDAIVAENLVAVERLTRTVVGSAPRGECPVGK